MSGDMSMKYPENALCLLKVRAMVGRVSRRIGLFCAASAVAISASAWAKEPPEYLKSAVVYQMVLRTFTRDGNFRAATEMLDHVKSIGVDIVYLTPFVEADRDMDESGWSPRQKKSGFHTPKNPYRISDYNKIDPEYGGDADFKAFNDKAHALGMKVYMDLVYMHCGPRNVLGAMYPDAFQRNPDGSVRTTSFKFPYVNFKSTPTRRYLIDSMLRWISLGCDGFRCDCADAVPLYFWEEATDACRAVKPDLGMINEGWAAKTLEKAFDACYALPWSYFVRDELIRSPFNKLFVKDFGAEGKPFDWRMDFLRDYEAKLPNGALTLCFLDNHDTANDDGESRFDRQLPVEAGNAAFTLVFLRRGVPLVYNGNEIADNSLNTFFAPVEDVARARKTVDWARALQPAGRKRLAHVRALARLRHEEAVFANGSQEWVKDGESQGAVAFVRRLGDKAVFVTANLKAHAVDFKASGVRPVSGARPMLAEGGELSSDGTCHLSSYGLLVVQIE